MPIAFACPICGTRTRTYMRVGETATCEACETAVVVPGSAVPTEEPVASVGTRGDGPPSRTGEPPRELEIGGTRLVCSHCAGKAFAEYGPLMDPRAFRHLAGLGEARGLVFACADCGFLHWFATDARVRDVPSDLPGGGR